VIVTAFMMADPEAIAAPMRFAQATQQAPVIAPSAMPALPAAPKADIKNQGAVGTPATVIDGQQAESLLGKQAQSATGEDMGRIVDVIVDKTGQMRAAVIDFGGFLGVGSRKIAVDWRSIRFPTGKMGKVIVDLPQNELRVAPVYKEGEPVVVLGPANGTMSKAPSVDASKPAEAPPAPKQ
jgi:hypothetical protein